MSKKSYPKAFQAEAVKAVLEQGVSVSEGAIHILCPLSSQELPDATEMTLIVELSMV